MISVRGQVARGRIGIGGVTRDGSMFVTREVFVEAGRPINVDLIAEELSLVETLIIRNVYEKGPSEFELRAVTMASLADPTYWRGIEVLAPIADSGEERHS